ncbi:hypothetical protein LTR53_002404 [Teratosphaeriaceae sp. CCFEE 6253]|nr:hypothetical protein LTR53_002404 [Teratosphaeriaceae sp. CCFEE 6253]
MAGSKQPCGFMALPTEIRIQIFEYLLVDHDGRRIHFTHSPHYSCSFSAIKEPLLLTVSKQLRKETLKVFYGSNVFHVPTTAALIVWLVRLGEEKRGLLRQVFGFDMPFQVSAKQDIAAARSEAGGVEYAVQSIGARLQDGVFRVPARVSAAGECMVWWVSHSSSTLIATRIGGPLGEVIGRADGERFLEHGPGSRPQSVQDVVKAMNQAVAKRGRCRCDRCREGSRREAPSRHAYVDMGWTGLAE